MEELFGSIEDLEQRKERQKIVDGTEWPDVDHEIADQTDVPALRFVNECPVNVIGRNRYLRQIVEKIIQKNLRRQHRQKRQEDRGRGHAEHVAEVRTRPH